MTAASPTIFGKYEIVRKLGRSLADVYLAFDPVEQRNIVLKLIELCDDPLTSVVVEAEKRGAAIQVQLHSRDRRILEVFEYGEQNGCFFIAMQYAEGSSLAACVEKLRRLDPNAAARIAREVASQLATLHAFELELDGRKQAVVHGDVKPSNIQIGPGGEVWLLDFGIAKAITATRNLTNHNLGSPAYCSPERLRRGQVDPHADLWALGVCLHEMVAGLPPYHAQSTRKLENLIQSRKPPRALPPSCPVPLRAIIRKALAADLENRYADAKAFESDLQSFLDGKKTVAESEASAVWDSNATLERPQEGRRPAVETVRVRRGFARWWIANRSLAVSLVAGIAVGLLCFIPAVAAHRFWNETAQLRLRRDYLRTSTADIESDFARLKSLERKGGMAVTFNLVRPLAETTRARMIAAGDAILASDRLGSNPDVSAFDWSKASLCFAHAIEIGPGDASLQAKRALAEGYSALGSSGSWSRAESGFREAARLDPGLPDAHLALARSALHGEHNIGKALAEFHAAERLGFKPGPREFEQQADGYLYRGQQEMKAARTAASDAARARTVALARRDFDRARALYEPIEGFSNVSARIAELDESEAAATKLAQPPPRVVVARRKPAYRSNRLAAQRRVYPPRYHAGHP